MDLIKKALYSAWNFLKLVVLGNLHLDRVRIGRSYHIGEYGEYSVFRETLSTYKPKDKPVVLVVGFRLKLLGTNKTMQWLFQKLCILTTPFWSGFEGFGIKLWMVKVSDDSYMGIYKWNGKLNAQNYVDTLVRVLTPLSVAGSVWYKIIEKDFEDYLHEHEYKLP